MRLRKSVGILAAACLALAALGASSAMAEEIPAKASATTIGLSATNITVKKNGGEAKNCELAPGGAGGGIESGALAWIKGLIPFNFRTQLKCAGGTTFEMDFYPSYLFYDTTSAQYKLRAGGHVTGPYASPWGSYEPLLTSYTGTWTNGSGSTNSTISFGETQTGILEPGGAKISFSGTFTATTAGAKGSLITLSH